MINFTSPALSALIHRRQGNVNRHGKSRVDRLLDFLRSHPEGVLAADIMAHFGHDNRSRTHDLINLARYEHGQMIISRQEPDSPYKRYFLREY